MKQIIHIASLLKNHTYKQVEQLTGIPTRTLIRRKNALKECKS
ncbi:hypothetical protein [Geomicrobium sp. JCM 19038]|nr:hypothetical protein [Geomicrobium sp. JCM 19038]